MLSLKKLSENIVEKYLRKKYKYREIKVGITLCEAMFSVDEYLQLYRS